MALLLVGLVLFIGIHSVRIVAPQWRESMMEQLGTRNWRLLHAVVALVGLLTIIMGYGYARYSATWLWVPPVWTRHIAALLVLLAFIFLVIAMMPYSKIKAKVGHPLILAIKLWAFAHLLSNGTSADILLFGSFLVWSVVNYAVSRRRDRKNGVVRTAPSVKYDLLALPIAVVAYGIFAFYLHVILIGVAPFAV